MCEFGRIGKSRINVLQLQRRTAQHDLITSCTLSDAVKDVGNENARSLGTKLAVANGRITGQVVSAFEPNDVLFPGTAIADCGLGETSVP